MPAAATAAPPTSAQRRALLLVGVAAFVAIGTLQSLYGPAFAPLQARYGVSVAQVGAIVSAHFGGAFLGVLGAGLVLARLGYRRSLLSAASAIAFGAALVAFAPSWPLALAAAFVAGSGFGQVTVAVNLMVARAYGAAATGPLNMLNGTYGFGAVLGPALVALVTARVAGDPSAGAFVFVVVALGAAGFALAASRLPWWPLPRRGGHDATEASLPVAGTAGGGPLAVVLFMLVFFLYVAAEVTTPAWIPTHLGPRFGDANAALVASGFWGALTLGRFLVAPLAARWRPRDLVLGSAGVAVVGLTVALVPPLTVVGYMLAGLGLAPIFPTTIAWLQWRFGDRGEQITPVVIAAGNLGPVLGAPAVGLAVAASGPAAVPAVLAGVALLLLAAIVATWWSGRRAERR